MGCESSISAKVTTNGTLGNVTEGGESSGAETVKPTWTAAQV